MKASQETPSHSNVATMEWFGSQMTQTIPSDNTASSLSLFFFYAVAVYFFLSSLHLHSSFLIVHFLLSPYFSLLINY